MGTPPRGEQIFISVVGEGLGGITVSVGDGFCVGGAEGDGVFILTIAATVVVVCLPDEPMLSPGRGSATQAVMKRSPINNKNSLILIESIINLIL